MILITSAAYVGAEFRVEMGKLVPAMLPIGNQPLFEHQIGVLSLHFPGQKIYLSLPEHYDLSSKDKRSIEHNNITIINVPEGLSLAESLLYVINSIGEYDGILRILHGDTLITDLPQEDNLIGVAKTHEDYNWEIESIANSEELVWCGFFAFNNIKSIVRYLVISQGNFVQAVRYYDEENCLSRVKIENWYDLGHVNTYFKSRSTITTQRGFNDLRVKEGCVIKKGYPEKKILAERQWFQKLPKQLKRFTPQLIDFGIADDSTVFYVLEYLCVSPLNELYVHGRNPSFFWNKVFGHCAAFFEQCLNTLTMDANDLKKIQLDSYSMILGKTRRRVANIADISIIDLDAAISLNGQVLPSLNSIVDECITMALLQPLVAGVMHGDFCFSNILFDTRADVLKVIDPRAINAEGEFSLVGNLHYDLAKLNHSVIGLYDFIISGAYKCKIEKGMLFNFEIYMDSRIEKIQEMYMEYTMLKTMNQLEAMPLTILLFISMVPLHSDRPERQIAFIANALRLYAKYVLVDVNK